MEATATLNGARSECRLSDWLCLTLDQLQDDPHPHLARLRETEPVSWVPALDGWLVTRRDLCVDVMRDAAHLYCR